MMHFVALAFLCLSVPGTLGQNLPEIPKFGRTITIHANGYFHKKPDPMCRQFKSILARAGVDTDEKVLQSGKDALQYFKDTFGIETSFVTDAVLSCQTPWPNITDSLGRWRFEKGIFGPTTNIHVISETSRTTTESDCRSPNKPVRLSFAFWKVTCQLEAGCPVKGGNVPKGTEAICQWLVAQQEDIDNGWDIKFLAKSKDMFHVHSERHPAIVNGVINDIIQSDTYGEGAVNGMLEIDATRLRPNSPIPFPHLRLWYIVTFKDLRTSLPIWNHTNPVQKPETCDHHWACLPPESEDDDPTILYGKTLSIVIDGAFARKTGPQALRDILELVDISGDKEIIREGKKALKSITDTFGIPTDFVNDDKLLEPSEAFDPTETWKFELNVFQRGQNLQIVAETRTDMEGNSKCASPNTRGMLMEYLVTCYKSTCSIEDKIITQGTTAYVQWLVADTSDFQARLYVQNTQLLQFYTYVDAKVSQAFFYDKNRDHIYGECEGNGALQVDENRSYQVGGETVPHFNVWWVVTCRELKPLDSAGLLVSHNTAMLFLGLILCFRKIDI